MSSIPSDTGAILAPAGRLLERYLEAQLAGDARGAIAVLHDGARDGVPVPSLYLDVVQEAQYRIGQLWQDNRVTIAQEHLATAISQRALAELYSMLPHRPPIGRQAVVACVGGEYHELGARIMADFLEMAGFEVRYLGASTPPDGLVSVVRDSNADLLAVSFTIGLHAGMVRDTVWSARSAVGDRLRVAVGGQGTVWVPALCDELKPEIQGRDARQAAQTAVELLGSVPVERTRR